MLANQLLELAEDLIADYDRLDVLGLVTAAAEAAAERATYTASQWISVVDRLHEHASRVLESTIVIQYPLDQRQLLMHSSFSQALPESIARVILAGFQRNNKNGSISSGEMGLYVSEFRNLYGRMLSYVDISRTLGVKSYPKPDKSFVLELRFPDIVYNRELERLSEKLRNFDRFLEVVGEICSGVRETTRVHWASTSTFVLAVTFGPITIGGVLYAYTQLLTVVEKHLTIAKLLRDLKAAGTDAKIVADGLKATEAASLDDAVAKVVENFGNNLTEGRRNELKIELRIVSESIIPDLAAGARMQITPRDQKELGQSDAIADSDVGSVQQQLEYRQSLEAKLDGMLDTGGREALGLLTVDRNDEFIRN